VKLSSERSTPPPVRGTRQLDRSTTATSAPHSARPVCGVTSVGNFTLTARQARSTVRVGGWGGQHDRVILAAAPESTPPPPPARVRTGSRSTRRRHRRTAATPSDSTPFNERNHADTGLRLERVVSTFVQHSEKANRHLSPRPRPWSARRAGLSNRSALVMRFAHRRLGFAPRAAPTIARPCRGRRGGGARLSMPRR